VVKPISSKGVYLVGFPAHSKIVQADSIYTNESVQYHRHNDGDSCHGRVERSSTHPPSWVHVFAKPTLPSCSGRSCMVWGIVVGELVLACYGGSKL
jgi:hypothetical protein